MFILKTINVHTSERLLYYNTILMENMAFVSYITINLNLEIEFQCLFSSFKCMHFILKEMNFN